LTIRLLGTGGADGIPSLFGEDPVSDWAREHGGHDVRTRAAAIVDEGLKIDLPPETFDQLLDNGLKASDWDILLFTHSDEDHLTLSELQYAVHPFTDRLEMPFPIFGNETVIDQIAFRYQDWPMELIKIRSFETFESAGYKITPLRARHTPGEECFNFLIEREGRRLIYATDTGVWTDETFEYLAGTVVHLLVLECTNAFRPATYLGHLDFDGFRYMLERMRKGGTLTEESRIVTTHHAATGGARHCDLQGTLAPLGAEPGYDGMIIEV
jgi:phosphoribosyl 1,2-cyclic phosphate phosphodiesterase